jgi:hypothetical protein
MTRNRLVFSQPYLEYLLPFLSALIFIPVLFNTDVISVGNTLNIFGEDFAGNYFNSGGVIYAICTLSTLLLSWALNNLINNHDLLYKSNYLPSLLAVIYTAAIVYSEGLSMALISMPFILLSLTSLLSSLGELGRLSSVFNSGFFLALAILLDSYAMAATPIYLGAIILFRPIEFRGVFVFLCGVLNVLFALVLMEVIFRSELPQIKDWISFYPSVQIQNTSVVSWLLTANYSLLSVLGLVCLPSYLGGMSNKAKEKGRVLLISFFILQLFVSVVGYSYSQDWSFFYFVPNVVYFSVIAYLSISNKYLIGLLNACHLILIGIITYHLVTN